MHPPKIETFDVGAMSNTDPKGIVRAVEEYRVEPFGLYMARPAPGRQQFRYLESWLLPDLGVRITDFWFNPGFERDQDFYVDIVSISRDGDVWRARDLYLDIILRTGRDLRIVDSDELVTATADGLLDTDEAAAALATSYTVVNGLAGHGYDLHAWLATVGVTLRWRRHDPAV